MTSGAGLTPAERGGVRGGAKCPTGEVSKGTVELDRVTKRYGRTVAVDRVSFVIESGTLVTLLGPSGCGKTTTLRMLAGLELPSEGAIRIGGRDVTNVHATERNVSMVFQSYALFPHLSVLENVMYGLLTRGSPRREAEARAAEALALVGLQGCEKRLPGELSGGQQQRVAVVRALVLEPEVLLFDEPLSNLDAKLRRRMRDEIRELQQRLGLTAVYVTHDQEEALSVSDRIIVMDRSVVVQEGSPRELYEGPDSLFVASFMGDANLVDGVVRPADPGSGDFVLELGALVVPLPLRARAVRAGPVRVAIRPEAITLTRRTGAGTAHLEGRVSRSAYLGRHMEYSVSTPVGDLFVVSLETLDPLLEGETVSISLRPDPGVTIVPG
ncbi:MAG: ABC transporter ATP-binding protein [Deltaproteobacteria bacterium]|nr:ABC transporter ATP-binding protein [Deltaproteobacteria bacterium]